MGVEKKGGGERCRKKKFNTHHMTNPLSPNLEYITKKSDPEGIIAFESTLTGFEQDVVQCSHLEFLCKLS